MSVLREANIQTVEAWQRALAHEVNTAASPSDGDILHTLSTLLGELGLNSLTPPMLKRALAMGAQRELLLPPLLDSLAEAHSLQELAQTLMTYGPQVDQREPVVCRSLARATSLLKQGEEAAEHWAALLRSDKAELADWREIAHFCLDSGFASIIAQATAETEPNWRDAPAAPFAHFCLSVATVEKNDKDAREQVGALEPDALNDAELALGTAVMGFRFLELDLARSAAEHALRLRPEWDVAESAKACFLCLLGEAPRELQRLRIDADVPHTVNDILTGTSQDEPVWGGVSRRQDGSIVSAWEPLASSRALAPPQPKGATPLATFSYFPCTEEGVCQDPSVCEVLNSANWKIPHYLAIRVAGELRVQPLVQGPTHPIWSWLPAVTAPEEETGCLDAKAPQGTTLWLDAVEELRLWRRESEDV